MILVQERHADESAGRRVLVPRSRSPGERRRTSPRPDPEAASSPTCSTPPARPASPRAWRVPHRAILRLLRERRLRAVPGRGLPATRPGHVRPLHAGDLGPSAPRRPAGHRPSRDAVARRHRGGHREARRDHDVADLRPLRADGGPPSRRPAPVAPTPRGRRRASPAAGARGSGGAPRLPADRRLRPHRGHYVHNLPSDLGGRPRKAFHPHRPPDRRHLDPPAGRRPPARPHWGPRRALRRRRRAWPAATPAGRT